MHASGYHSNARKIQSYYKTNNGGTSSRVWSSAAAHRVNIQRNKRLTSAYSNIKSRIDSGLYVSTHSRSMSHNDLRFKDDANQIKSDVEELVKCPVEVLALVKEAKDEIIRLQKIGEQQQVLISTLLRRGSQESFAQPDLVDQVTNTASTTQITYTVASSYNNIVNNQSESLISVKPTSSKQLIHGSENEFNEISNKDYTQILPEDEDTTSVMWKKYQQILLNKESSQKISSDIHALIKRLYKALQEAQGKVARLNADFSAYPQSTSRTLEEEHKQIEICRKENTHLHNSLNQFVKQIITPEKSELAFQEPPIINHSKNSLDSEFIKMKSKIKSLKAQLSEQNEKYDYYKHQYESMLAIGETDQLKMRHLEQKVLRLSSMLFGDFYNNTIGFDQHQFKVSSSQFSLIPDQNINSKNEDQTKPNIDPNEQVLFTLDSSKTDAD